MDSLFQDKVRFPWQEKKRLDVVALKQLDRDTLFMAYEDRVGFYRCFIGVYEKCACEEGE